MNFSSNPTLPGLTTLEGLRRAFFLKNLPECEAPGSVVLAVI